MTDSRPRPNRSAYPERCRTDGWTPDRQLRFLDSLAATRSVTKAAAVAGMSRESAYRLRDRRDGALFAAMWDRALAFQPLAKTESHNPPLTTGRIMRILGTQYRRKRGDFRNIGRKAAESPPGSSDGNFVTRPARGVRRGDQEAIGDRNEARPGTVEESRRNARPVS